MPILLQGSHGPEVKLAQAALNFHARMGDEKLVLDGAFGNKTKAQTIRFQQAAGLNADGIIGPLTQAKLFATVEVTGEVHHCQKKPAAAQQRSALPIRPLTSFPQLTLPPIVPPRPPLRLIPPLTFSVPLVQGESTWAPPRIFSTPTTPAVQIFPIRATFLQPLWHAPLVLQDKDRDETHASWTEFRYRQTPIPGDVTTALLSPYIDIKETPSLKMQGVNDFKVKAGLKAKTKLGGFELKMKFGSTIVKYDQVTGEVKAGVLTFEGLFTVQHRL